MDEFAFHDIPDSIDYVLSTSFQSSLSYVGFSQGTAQAFAALSIHPTLNDKVDVFIALAPAMSPSGLASPVVDALMKTSPEVVFLAFGRRSLMSSATMWQLILYPPIFVRLIDMSLSGLFNWRTRNITPHQKLAAYPHLYSFTSTKSVVHWFQIIRNKSFQMYDDDVQAPFSVGVRDRYYKVAKFPTRNIKTPIVLVYGGSDSLVDINVMLKELPRHTVAKEIPHFEHVDLLWAEQVDSLVFPHVFDALNFYSEQSNKKALASSFSPWRSPNTHTSSQPPSYSEDETPKSNNSETLSSPPSTVAEGLAAHQSHSSNTPTISNKDRPDHSTALLYHMDGMELPRTRQGWNGRERTDSLSSDTDTGSVKAAKVGRAGISIRAPRATLGDVDRGPSGSDGGR